MKNKILTCLTLLLISIIGITGSTPIYAVNETTQTADVTVQDMVSISANWDTGTDINFGSLLPGTVTAFDGREIITSVSNVDIKLSTRASGNFTGTNGTIGIDQLSYGGYGENVPYTPFSTLYSVVKSRWTTPAQGSVNTASVNYRLTVPAATPTTTENM